MDLGMKDQNATEADLDGFVRDGFRLDVASGTDCINNSGDDYCGMVLETGETKVHLILMM